MIYSSTGAQIARGEGRGAWYNWLMGSQAEWDFLSPEEKLRWAWLAGIIDGEGYIGLSLASRRDGYYHSALVLRISMTHRETLLEIQRITNLGSVFEARPATRNWKTAFEWRVYNKEAAAVLRTCISMLVTKRDQAAIAIKFQEFVGLTQHGGVPLSPGQLSQRQALVEAMHLLNRRGPALS